MTNKKKIQCTSFASTCAMCAAVFLITEEKFILGAILFGLGTVLMGYVGRLKRGEQDNQ